MANVGTSEKGSKISILAAVHLECMLQAQLERRRRKVKCTLVQALRLCTGRTSYKRSRDIALHFLGHGTKRGEGSASRPGHS